MRARTHTHTQQLTPGPLAERDGRYKWAPDGPDGAAADLGPGEEFDVAAIRAARAAAAAEASGPAPGSSRTMKADVEGILAGYLGKKVPYTGKACVMELLTPAGAAYAKFSKCVGEWSGMMGVFHERGVWWVGTTDDRSSLLTSFPTNHNPKTGTPAWWSGRMPSCCG